MNSQKLSALISSLISQLFLVLLLLFPDANSTQKNLFPVISNILSSQQVVAFLSVSRKRKRTHLPEQDSEPTPEDKVSKLGPGIVELGLTHSPDSFRNSFKMKYSTFRWLSGLLEPLLDCRDPVGSPLNLSADLRLGIGLFRLVTGSSYGELANRFGVSESVTRFCVKQLCRVLCTNFRFWVAFPSTEELKSISKSFEELSGLPNCCGVVDCTRFKIVKIDGSKSAKDEKFSEDSVAVQIVVDSSSRILSIVAGIRGDKGDSRVLKSSTLYKDIEEKKLLDSSAVFVNGVAVDQYLIGDGGYPLLPWLMVPFVDAKPGSIEENFNVAHSVMRAPALRTIASLKNWGVLSRPIEEEFKTAVALIGACSILHNILLMRDDDSGLYEELGDFSMHDQSSQYYSDASLEENSVERKASFMRIALAARARSCHDSSSGRGPSSSVQ